MHCLQYGFASSHLTRRALVSPSQFGNRTHEPQSPRKKKGGRGETKGRSSGEGLVSRDRCLYEPASLATCCYFRSPALLSRFTIAGGGSRLRSCRLGVERNGFSLGIAQVFGRSFPLHHLADILREPVGCCVGSVIVGFRAGPFGFLDSSMKHAALAGMRSWPLRGVAQSNWVQQWRHSPPGKQSSFIGRISGGLLASRALSDRDCGRDCSVQACSACEEGMA